MLFAVSTFRYMAFPGKWICFFIVFVTHYAYLYVLGKMVSPQVWILLLNSKKIFFFLFLQSVSQR